MLTETEVKKIEREKQGVDRATARLEALQNRDAKKVAEIEGSTKEEVIGSIQGVNIPDKTPETDALRVSLVKRQKKIDLMRQQKENTEIELRRWQPTEFLTIMHMKLIEYYALGYNILQSAMMASLSSYEHERGDVKVIAEQALAVIESPAGQEYLAKLTDEYKDGRFISKNRIVRELVSRIPVCSVDQLVKVSQTLNTMLDYNDAPEIAPALLINWVKDPWIEGRTVQEATEKMVGEAIDPSEMTEVQYDKESREYKEVEETE